MLIVISPAKTLDYTSPVPTDIHSQPAFLKESRQLMKVLRTLSPEDLSSLMHISSTLGDLNFQRNLAWRTPFTPANARQALFAFKGDVYLGLKASEFSAADLEYAQDHLRILSGLYGLLRPLDLMQPYRLEMGTALANDRGEDLYAFWGNRLTRALKQVLAEQTRPALVNLASQEYFGALQPDALKVPLITPAFKDFSNGKYRFLSFFAKQARGSMTAWILRHRIDDPARLVEFDVDGYRYSAADSTPTEPVFLRRRAA